MKVEELWDYQKKVVEYKEYMREKISNGAKFNSKYQFSAEEAAYITLNRMQKEMVTIGNQEPSAIDLRAIQEAETIIDIDKGVLTKTWDNYTQPLYFFWNQILIRLDGKSYIEFFKLIIQIALIQGVIERDSTLLKEMLDDSVTMHDRDWVTECLCNVYRFLNSNDDESKSIRDEAREIAWADDYSRKVFNYIK